jgi:hypothetical protein
MYRTSLATLSKRVHLAKGSEGDESVFSPHEGRAEKIFSFFEKTV